MKTITENYKFSVFGVWKFRHFWIFLKKSKWMLFSSATYQNFNFFSQIVKMPFWISTAEWVRGLHASHTLAPHLLFTQCTMGLYIALRISKITKSKGPDFAQFWSKPSDAVWDRWKTAQIFREKYFRQIFIKNVVLIVEKHEGHDC